MATKKHQKAPSVYDGFDSKLDFLVSPAGGGGNQRYHRFVTSMIYLFEYSKQIVYYQNRLFHGFQMFQSLPARREREH
jgi:hypothetical protein